MAETITETPTPSEPAPDPLLFALYASERPPVELLPGVGLSPIVNACWLLQDEKAMLEENWMPSAPEEIEGAPPPLAFDPKAAEYNDMQRRLSRSEPLVKWNELTISIRELERAVETTKGEELEANRTALDEARAQLTEVSATLTELKASFAEDPLSLVPWMQTLFDLADAGLTTFDVHGRFFPYCGLSKLFNSNNTVSYYTGAERVLGLFKRRYERERGPNKIQILAKLIPNIFQDGYNASMVEEIVNKIKRNIFGDETQDSIDLVQLYWFDFQERDVLPTLKALQKLTEDKVEINTETGEELIIEPKKVRGIGLLDFPHSAVKAAVQAGVPITCVSLAHSVVDRSNQQLLSFCKEYNIKVLVRDGTLGGLVHEKFLGTPCPDSKTLDPDLENPPYCLDLIAKSGGWAEFQKVLKTFQAIAKKHDVRMQTVALRWQIDQGTFPIVALRWTPHCWKQFGYRYLEDPGKPGLDAALMQKASFLDPQDVSALMGLWKS